MSTHYREIHIATLEQAKALPHGTIVRLPTGKPGDFTVLALSDLKHPGKPTQRFWFATFSMNAYLDDAVVGGTALLAHDEQTAQEQVQAVRDLHVPDETTGACSGCYSTWPGYTEEHPTWPCATLRALDGEATT